MTLNRGLQRKWIFRIIAIGIGLLPLFLLEAGLRIAGVGSQPAYLAMTHESGHLHAVDHDPFVDLHSLKPLFERSKDGSQMEIGPSRLNFFCPAAFPLVKGNDTYRIFALGGSTTQGQPYRTETAFPAWLGLRLKAAMPGRNIEIINAGGISYASYRVAAILDEVLQYQPDLIVLYTGHNEFLEARSYAVQHRVPRWMARPLSSLANLRVSRVASQFVRSGVLGNKGNLIPQATIPVEVDTMLDHVDGMDTYQRDEAWIEGVHQHFERTLDQMVTRCRAKEVPLVLCVPASDLINSMPFKSMPDPALSESDQQKISKWTSSIASPMTEQQQRFGHATAIVELDPNHALANFVIGRSLYESDESRLDEAKDRLRAARDHDVCPLRATARIESAVKAYESNVGVHLIDTTQLLDVRNAKGSSIPDGLPDSPWFLDHVHPTIAGHQRIAEEIYKQLCRAGSVVPTEDAEDQFKTLVIDHMESLDNAYFIRAQQRLEGVLRWSRRVPSLTSIKPQWVNVDLPGD